MDDDFENTVAGTQREAWWMDDPRDNWIGSDAPLWPVAVSSAYLGADGQVSTQPSANTKEYLFDKSQLDILASTYYDEFGCFIGLPTCPLDDISVIPEHSAVLVGWFTPAGVDSQYVAGEFISKWGEKGIYYHRYGFGYCPDIYRNTLHLQVFAPRKVDWPYVSPPYLIAYSPWGLF